MKTATDYLSRDLRKIIDETLRQHNIKPTRQLIEAIYDLVMTEATDAQYMAVSKKVDAAIARLFK